MKWHSPLPRRGDYRVRKAFAWLPVQIGQDKIWLEWYWIRDRYLFLGPSENLVWTQDDISQDIEEVNEWKMDIEIMQQGR